MKTKVETYLELWWEFVEHSELLLLSWVVQHDVLKRSTLLLGDLVTAQRSFSVASDVEF